MSALVKAAEFAQRWSLDRALAQLLPVTPEHLAELSQLAAVLFENEIETARAFHLDKNLMLADVSYYPGTHRMFVLANWHAEGGQLEAGLFICEPAHYESSRRQVC